MKKSIISLLMALVVLWAIIPVQAAITDLDRQHYFPLGLQDLVTKVNGNFDYLEQSLGTVNTEFTSEGNDITADQKVVITIDDYELIMGTDGGTDTHGAVKLIDLPEGYIEVTGILVDLACTNTATGVDNDTEYDFGIGSTETDGDGGQLDTNTDSDVLGIIGGDLDGSYNATIQSQSITGVGLDGTGGAEDLWLNMAYLDADVTGETTNTVAGTVTIFWRNLGDY